MKLKKHKAAAREIPVSRPELQATVAEVYHKPGKQKLVPAAEAQFCGKPGRLQWDPDHQPCGEPHIYRKAIQIGIKGRLAEAFASADKQLSPILLIEDVTDFVHCQVAHSLVPIIVIVYMHN